MLGMVWGKDGVKVERKKSRKRSSSYSISLSLSDKTFGITLLPKFVVGGYRRF